MPGRIKVRLLKTKDKENSSTKIKRMIMHRRKMNIIDIMNEFIPCKI